MLLYALHDELKKILSNMQHFPFYLFEADLQILKQHKGKSLWSFLFISPSRLQHGQHKALSLSSFSFVPYLWVVPTTNINLASEQLKDPVLCSNQSLLPRRCHAAQLVWEELPVSSCKTNTPSEFPFCSPETLGKGQASSCADKYHFMDSQSLCAQPPPVSQQLGCPVHLHCRAQWAPCPRLVLLCATN